jgi:hypothetical protein
VGLGGLELLTKRLLPRHASEPGLASLIYRRSGRGSCTRCSVFLRADRSFRPFWAFISRISANSPELAAIRHAFCLCTPPIELQGPFRRSLSLPWKIAFPDGGDWRW